jgi:hypothetical protein
LIVITDTISIDGLISKIKEIVATATPVIRLIKSQRVCGRQS